MADGEVYRAIRQDLLDELGADPAAVADLRVPACPEWTVKDVLAHLGGVAADALAGNLDGVSTDAWTAAQVDARRSWTLAEVLEEWARNGPVLDEALTALGAELDPRALLDAWTHQHDVREALGRGPAPEPVGRWHTARTLLDRVGDEVAAGRLPPLRVVLDGSVRLDAGGATVVRTSTHEWARALLGRRSRRQVLAWSWTGTDPAGFLDGLQVFAWSAVDQRA
jgi:uncharacterized protein (TIGR03083 family)